MQSGFFIKFQYQSEWITLPKIRLVDEKNAARHTSYYLPDDGATIITEKIATNQYAKLYLTSTNESSTRLIAFQPFYLVCNFSNYQLSFYAFCIHRTEKFTHSGIVKILTEQATPIAIENNHSPADNMYVKNSGLVLYFL